MKSILAQAIITKVRTVLQDPTAIRYGDAELLGWINSIQRAIYARIKDASTKVTTIELHAGTRQAIPAEADLLLDIPRNVLVTASGCKPGRSIRKVEMSLIDAQRPYWHAQREEREAKDYVYDPRVPGVFYVYPPVLEGTRVEAKYAIPPTDVLTVDAVIGVDDVYEPLIINGVLWRAYSKETEESLRDRAVLYKQAFDAELDMKSGVDSVTHANAVEA